MTRGFKIYAAAWSAIVCTLLVFSMSIKTRETNMFSLGISLAFLIAAHVLQLFYMHGALKGSDLGKLFYNVVPAIICAVLMILLSVIVIAVAMISDFPVHAALLLSLIVSILGIISLAIWKNTVSFLHASDKNTLKSVRTLRALSDSAEELLISSNSEKLRNETKKVYEAFRFAEQISPVSVYGLNEQIALQFEAFRDAVRAEDEELATAVGCELITLINIRNAKCNSKKIK